MKADLKDALTKDQLVDITTTGRQSGTARRIEIGLHPRDGHLYITGVPGFPRSWYANLLNEPKFILHIKQTTIADLTATARPITEHTERERVLASILPSLTQHTSVPGREPEVWIRESPLIEVTPA